MRCEIIAVRALILIALVLSITRAPVAFAQAPTEEPTKRPYVFPTPIFVPTYPNDTSQPPPTRTAPTATQSAIAATEQPSGDQIYTVQPGDSLWIIAQKVYGNGAKYPLIANANDITTTTRLRTGTILKIPSAPGLVTATPTSAPPTPTPAATRAPIATPTAASPTPTPSPTSASLIPASLVGSASTAINILSAIFVLASLISAALACWRYARTQHLNRIAEGKPPIRLR